MVISTSGGYEAVDTLKSIKPGAHILGMNVNMQVFYIIKCH